MYQGPFILIPPYYRTPGINDIRKHHGRAQEYIIFTNNPRIDRNIVLDLDVVAENYPRGYHYILSDIASGTNSGSWHDMGEMPDPAAFTYLTTFIDYGGFMCEELL